MLYYMGATDGERLGQRAKENGRADEWERSCSTAVLCPSRNPDLPEHLIQSGAKTGPEVGTVVKTNGPPWRELDFEQRCRFTSLGTTRTTRR